MGAEDLPVVAADVGAVRVGAGVRTTAGGAEAAGLVEGVRTAPVPE